MTNECWSPSFQAEATFSKVDEMGLDVQLSQAHARELLQMVKEQENKGFQYEGTEASF